MGLTGISVIAGGAYHTIALKTDGTVWTWGANQYGQLGDGTYTGSNIPVQVSELTGITQIAGGLYYTIALKNDGTVWAWGDNYYGQLGDGTTTNRNTPVQAMGFTGVSVIAGGGVHTIALKNDGTVWTWGANWYGQLGDGTTDDKYTPVQVGGLTDVFAIAGGGFHSVAVKKKMEGGKDTTPPTISCLADPSILWPPNHKLVPITITVTVTDEESGPAGFILLSVESNESDNGIGDGNTNGDIQGADIGTADTEVLFRAERSGSGAGRIYTLTYEGADVAGNTATCDAIVRVSHDRR